MATLKISITCITPVLQAILDFFPDIISFQHVLHLGVGISQIECKLKVKTQISVFPWANIGQNDHSNPYIERRVRMWHCTSGVQGLPGIPEDEKQGKEGRETAWSEQQVGYTCIFMYMYM